MSTVPHSIASDQVSWQGIAARVPKGTVHAVLDNLNSTACGLSLDGLHKFPDLDFDQGSTDQICTACLKWTSGAAHRG
jgi:hypothetical protein